MSRIIGVLVFIVVVATGCKVRPENQPGAGQFRIELFKECMVLAKDTVQDGHYNDSAEVIQECSNQAWYMTRHHYKSGMDNEA